MKNLQSSGVARENGAVGRLPYPHKAQKSPSEVVFKIKKTVQRVGASQFRVIFKRKVAIINKSKHPGPCMHNSET